MIPPFLLPLLPLSRLPCRLSVLEDMWEYEAQFCAARHQLVLQLVSAYRHSAALGVDDLWAGISDGVKPFASGHVDAWAKFSSNLPQPKLLAARVQLRRELIDLCFRWGITSEHG